MGIFIAFIIVILLLGENTISKFTVHLSNESGTEENKRKKKTKKLAWPIVNLEH